MEGIVSQCGRQHTCMEGIVSQSGPQHTCMEGMVSISERASTACSWVTSSRDMARVVSTSSLQQGKSQHHSSLCRHHMVQATAAFVISLSLALYRHAATGYMVCWRISQLKFIIAVIIIVIISSLLLLLLLLLSL